MIVLLDTSTGLCRLAIVDGDDVHEHNWQADRQLARGLLGFIEQSLAQHDGRLGDIAGIGVYRGPGSYTGLRIGITVMNTIADAHSVPIVGVAGEQWRDRALERLATGDDDQLVLPEYGGGANITTPRK